ncbi:MAG: glycosyltransferase family 1 protein [Ignavibacteriales bacterium]|nr:glycosyltransferase family 1 protein [Ignavibacteriales bacterium]
MIFINARFLTKRITGVERYATEISLALKKIDREIILLSPNRVLKESCIDKFNIKKVGFTNNYFWEQFELPLFLRKNNNPLLINLTNTAPVIYKNQITVIHDLAFIHNPGWYTKKAAQFFKWLVKRSALSSKHIITVSNFSKGEIVKYLNISSEKISVVPEAIPSRIVDLSHLDYPNKWGNYILAVSTLEPRKNLVSLIKAFLKLNLNCYKLLIVGAQNKIVFKELELDRLKLNDNIVFLGYVDDPTLVGLYKNAKLFTYISYYEGFGIPPLEALVCGCPVLASNSSSIPEVCGEYAKYCNPYDINDIAGKMNDMISQPSIISDKQIKDLLDRYNWEKTSLLFMNIVRAIESGNNKS